MEVSGSCYDIKHPPNSPRPPIFVLMWKTPLPSCMSNRTQPKLPLYPCIWKSSRSIKPSSFSKNARNPQAPLIKPETLPGWGYTELLSKPKKHCKCKISRAQWAKVCRGDSSAAEWHVRWEGQRQLGREMSSLLCLTVGWVCLQRLISRDWQYLT